MRVMIDFFRSMLRLPMPWPLWILALMVANGVLPLLYLGTPEARVVLGAMMVGAVTQMAIFAKKGFVRLLGAGHFLWLIMLPWLWTRLGDAPAGLFRNWILAVLVVNGISVIIDVTDVVRYLKGDRDPQIVLEGTGEHQ